MSGKMWRTSELAALGFSDRAISSMIRSGTLVRLRRGCYIDRRRWEELSHKEREVYRILAHAQPSGMASGTSTLDGGSAGPSGSSTAYSHATAARLHNLHLWDVPARIHITYSTRRSTLCLPPDVQAHYRKLTTAETEVVRGVAVTSIERTVIDCALSLEFRKALIIADHALHTGADLETLRSMLAGLDGVRGIRNARAVLAAANELCESPGETLTRVLLLQFGLPMPELQLEVVTDGGRHRLDFGWKDRKVALEFDGDTKYFDYAPTSEVLLLERKREKALMEQGWRFVRLEWKDLFRPEYVEQRLLAALFSSR